MENRNPYLVLGIPFGSTRDEATKAFARRTRPLRRMGDRAKSELTDLTWALHEIDEAPANPELALTPYRLPADPEAAKVGGTGVFSPGPEQLPIDAEAVQSARLALRMAAAHEYLRYLVRLRGSQLGQPTP